MQLTNKCRHLRTGLPHILLPFVPHTCVPCFFLQTSPFLQHSIPAVLLNLPRYKKGTNSLIRSWRVSSTWLVWKCTIKWCTATSSSFAVAGAPFGIGSCARSSVSGMGTPSISMVRDSQLSHCNCYFECQKLRKHSIVLSATKNFQKW